MVAVGSVHVVIGILVDTTGFHATAQLGDAVAHLNTPAQVSGLEAVTALGDTGVSVSALVPVTGFEATTALGDFSLSFGIKVQVTGVEAVGYTGVPTFTISGSVTIEADGLVAITKLNSGFGPAVLVWGLVNDGQAGIWKPVPVADDQFDNWLPVIDRQRDTWVPVIDG